ncbi:Uncharacterised protein [Hafnia alvei]|jgi:hypothetical protein|nr:Uncharacterised protein [Hafnia alvei]
MKTSIFGITPISVDVCHLDGQISAFTHFSPCFYLVQLTQTLHHRADLLRL